MSYKTHPFRLQRHRGVNSFLPLGVVHHISQSDVYMLRKRKGPDGSSSVSRIQHDCEIPKPAGLPDVSVAKKKFLVGKTRIEDLPLHPQDRTYFQVATESGANFQWLGFLEIQSLLAYTELITVRIARGPVTGTWGMVSVNVFEICQPCNGDQRLSQPRPWRFPYPNLCEQVASAHGNCWPSDVC